MSLSDSHELVIACSGDSDAAVEGGADQESLKYGVIPSDFVAPESEPDFPPDSFWLSKDAEYDWFDRNVFYERKDSTKGGNNSSLNPSSNSNSQRFSVSLKSKASIIGLPKTQKATFVESKRRTGKPASMRLFPNRSDSVGKSSVVLVEPGSPKVSCIGRVRSKRCRRRSNSTKRREKQIEKSRSSSGGEKQKAGFYSKVMSMFRKKKGHRKPSRSASRKVAEEEHVVVGLRRRSVSVKVRGIPITGETKAEEPTGLGEMKRFTSGRRSEVDRR